MTDIASTAHGPGGLFSNPALGNKPLRKCKSARLRAEKQATFGGTPRKDLPDSAFIDPDKRSFPVMTAQDVRDAVSSWGRYTGNLSFEQFKERLTRRARAIGAADALPEKWQTAKKADDGYNPPEAARNNARQALEWRRKYGHGGTGVGVARARDLANGRKLSRSTVGRMRNFFARHGQYRATKHAFIDGKPTPWRVAWDLWGGDSARSWVEGISLKTATSEKVTSLHSPYAYTLENAEQYPNSFLELSTLSDLPVQSCEDFHEVTTKPMTRSEAARAAALARWGKYTPQAKPKPVKGKKPKKDPAQAQAERDAKRNEQRRANEAAVGEQAGLGSNLSDALMEFASPDESITLAPQNAAALEKVGLVEKNPDGSYRISNSGRAYVAAARSGDVARARDAIGRAGSQTERRNAIAQRRAEADAKRLAKEQEKKDPKKAGGSKGGSGGSGDKQAEAKPSKEEQRAASGRETADKVGLSKGAYDALASAADGTGGSPELDKLGLTANGQATDQGRRALSALERGDTRQYQAALQDAKARMDREAAAAKRAEEVKQRRRETEAKQAIADAEARQRQQEEIRQALTRLLTPRKTKVKRSHSYWRTYREQRKAGLMPLEARKVAKEQVLRLKLDRNHRQRNMLAGALIGIR